MDPCRTDLLGLAENIQQCIRGLGKPGRRDEVDCGAALVSSCSWPQEKSRHTNGYRCHVPVSHCSTFLLVDNAVHSLVAHCTDSTGGTGRPGGSDLYQAVQVLIAVGLDFEDHCEGVVLPLLVLPVAVAQAATFHPYPGPCLRTARCRHRRSCHDLANPRCTRRIHPKAHGYFDIAAEAHVEDYH